MKVLALSLARVGDLLMHGHVLRALKDQTQAEITLLTHPFFKSIEFLFPYLKKTYLFERDHCQKTLGQEFYNKSWAPNHVDKLLKSLHQENFDLIIDLSQTDTSARWMTCLQGREKIGVQYSSNRSRKEFCSPNPHIQRLHSTSMSESHLVEVFIKSLGLNLPPRPRLDLQSRRTKRILFQTLTSDGKKNWPFQSWRDLIQKVHGEFPEYELVILSSPNDFSQLADSFSSLGDFCRIAVTSFKEVYDLLFSSVLLVTLDTSIKHLATYSGIGILEIAVGSSNPLETGAYQEGVQILRSTSSCSPCKHSKACPYDTYHCHESITPMRVFEAMKFQLQQQTTKKEILTPNQNENEVTHDG